MSPTLPGCPGLNFNNVIQISYRFSIVEEVHVKNICTNKYLQDIDEKEMILELQPQQNVQTAYAVDYQNRRSAQDSNEVKEVKKGRQHTDWNKN